MGWGRGEWRREGGGDSPVEDSDDDLMPGSLCNVIPGMVNIDTARKQKSRLRLVYFILRSTAKIWSWDLDLKSHTKQEGGTRQTLVYKTDGLTTTLPQLKQISHSIFLFF